MAERDEIKRNGSAAGSSTAATSVFLLTAASHAPHRLARVGPHFLEGVALSVRVRPLAAVTRMIKCSRIPDLRRI